MCGSSQRHVERLLVPDPWGAKHIASEENLTTSPTANAFDSIFLSRDSEDIAHGARQSFSEDIKVVRRSLYVIRKIGRAVAKRHCARLGRQHS